MCVDTQSRDSIVEKLKRELIGPDPLGRELDCQSPVIFKDKKESYQPFVQKGSGEEILQRDSPLTRYGAGILYPFPAKEKQSNRAEVRDPVKRIVFGEGGEIVGRETKFGDFRIDDTGGQENPAPLPADTFGEANIPDLSGANKRLPNSMAITFLAETHSKSQLIVNAAGGRYHPLPVRIENEKRIFWRREEVKLAVKFNNLEAVFSGAKLKASIIESVNAENLNLSVEAAARPTGFADRLLITLVLVNRTETPSGKMPDAYALFQAEFSARVVSPGRGNRLILPYPADHKASEARVRGSNGDNNPSGGSRGGGDDDDDRSIDLLYRRARTYAVGHGCAADWDKKVGADERVREVVANSFPVFEVPRVSSDIKRADGTILEISMAKLAGLVPGDDGTAVLEEMLDAYADWIGRRDRELGTLAAPYHYAGHRHLTECRDVLARMRDGLQFLRQDARAREAFRLANRAILIQQHRSRLPLRQMTTGAKRGGDLVFERKAAAPDLLDAASSLGAWRAFQIAFLLASLRSAVCPDSPARETVDLIWFPTGGGKTEAYLSLAAFAIFYRRLCDPADAGTAVFMRYTLRLLTAQQFQRTAALICAMETLRRENPERLGAAEISIGLWLGNEVTPGTRRDAMSDYDRLVANPQFAENKFILNRCPWCAAEIGRIEIRKNKNGNGRGEREFYIRGYKKEQGTVLLHCPDADCRFHEQLPIYVTDEDLYEKCPTLFIATVDKFAVLAWKPQARALFGLDRSGTRVFSPPGLINQDELHLITGPLGTMVALYEPLVEELCTDRREGGAARPKIIAATATTRAYREQIGTLYGRDRAQLFPPPGLDAGNSFFARYARDEQGDLLPGRLYAGINAPGLGSLQNAEVRAYTALLQAVSDLPAGQRDAYWSLMVFFNNLKSLGNTVSLFQANVQSYFLAHQSRTHRSQIRRIRHPLELTGQLRGDEVLAALKKLETNYCEGKNSAVDVCLCSSIVEVGMDISRLSLMTVVSQPKTAAQYIQVSSRVGRSVQHPGLVAVIFSPFNMRDRSHYERFRSFHERLYAHVEPGSATPFAPPALERALHAVLSAFVRQTGSLRQAVTPHPVPEARIEQIKKLMLARLQKIAPEMQGEFERIYARRIKEWHHWEQTAWSADSRAGDDAGLLRAFDRWATEEVKSRSWATPVSMRTVDTESELRVTTFYRAVEQAEASQKEEKGNEKSQGRGEEVI